MSTAISSSSSTSSSTTTSVSTSSSASTGGSSTGSGSGGSSGFGPGSRCDPQSLSDPCVDAGYECTLNACVEGNLECIVTGPQDAGTCQVPSEFAPCSTTVGCAQPYQCLNWDIIFDQEVGFLCIQPCSADAGTASCADPADICEESGANQQYYCYTDPCGPDLPSSDNGLSYYGPCSSQGTNDATCVPWYTSNIGTIGYCEQAGTAPLVGPCGPSRNDAGSAALCPLDRLCVQGDGGSFCAPMCAPDGGVSGSPDGGYSARCAGGSVCVATSGLQGSEDGACLSSCTSSASCTAPMTCQDGICLP